MNEEGKLKKSAKTLNQIRNDLPKIIRTSEKMEETINVRSEEEYVTEYVPLSKIDEAKKDIQPLLEKLSITNAILIDDLIELRNKFRIWFGKK